MARKREAVTLTMTMDEMAVVHEAIVSYHAAMRFNKVARGSTDDERAVATYKMGLLDALMTGMDGASR